MNPYLYSIAQAFYNNEGDAIKDNTFIFPSRRAELFFTKYLSQIANKPIFSPNTLTIDDFVSQLSGYAPADRVEMLFVLYNNYKELSSSNESFDDFFYWADILLTDFDDVDKYMVDASQLFSNIYELKEIETHFKDSLTAEQKAFLSRFIENFKYDENPEGVKKEFVTFWKVLNKLYEQLKSDLAGKGCAYNGMMLRSIIEQVESNKITVESIKLRYKKVVFVGFNILSTAEERVMSLLRDMGVADFYWDYNTPVSDDIYSFASSSIKESKEKFPSRYIINEPPIKDFPQIEVVAIPSNIGQTKYAGEIISKIVSQDGLKDESETVVVLPDEKLLLPMIYSIPSNVDSINITMGYPMSETPLHSMFKALFELHASAKIDAEKNQKFYHQNVLTLLQQPYIRLLHNEQVVKFISDIKTKNIVYINRKNIPDELKYLFQPLTDNKTTFEFITAVISNLIGGVSDNDLITKEFLFHYKTVINRLQNIVNDEQLTLQTLFKLIEKMSAMIKVPFSGEPLSGLQVMGLLETRTLDFENVIILSMNEGVFPADSRGDTFIPYNVRRGFGMSSYEHRDGIAEYYFYRLISRAKRVFITYDTRTEGVKVGDLSRFVYQLKYQYMSNSEKFKEKSANYTIKMPEDSKIEIQKSGVVADALKEFYKGGAKSLSASSINTYIDCPLKFYLSYIEKIKKSEKVLEDLDASIFGTIYHEVMQNIYTKYEGKEITKEIIDKILSDKRAIETLVKNSFFKNYYKNDKSQQLAGKLYLRSQVVIKMVERTLEIDKGRAPFIMLKNELKIDTIYELSNGQEVRIRGFIDRLDFKDDIINIIDYKSGSVTLEYTSIEELFKVGTDKRPKEILQLIFYVLMLRQGVKYSSSDSSTNLPLLSVMEQIGVKAPYINKLITPGLYAFANYFAKEFEWRVKKKKDTSKNFLSFSEISDIYDEYLQYLDNVLMSIFNEEQPFTQTENKKICEYCDFANLCRK